MKPEVWYRLRRNASWAAVGLSALALLWPVLMASTLRLDAGVPLGTVVGDQWLALGTDRWGVPFVSSVLGAMGASGRVALAGTVGVLLGAILLGTFEANLRSRGGRVSVQVLTLAAMAMPDITLLLTVHAALPRETSGLAMDVVVLGVVGALWIPPTSRLVASRVQAIRATLFYRAAFSLGATRWHLLRREVLPHLTEDVAWLFASIFPRFLHVELGLAYIGLEYHFKGLGVLLKSSYEHRPADPYMWQLAIASLTAVWLSLLPMLVLRALGMKPLRSE